MSEREPGYLRIGELARRTGTSPELLRAWERRYGLLRPARSQGGFRLYTTADEARIRRMRDHLAHGVAAAQAARLAIDADATGQHAMPPGADAPPPATTPAAPPPPLQAAARELAGALDRFGEEPAHAVLDRLLAAYQTETVLRALLIPYLHDLGERWARGEVTVAQEHFAANLLRGRLLGLARGWGQGRGPLAVLACLPDEQHDLGLLAFGITLQRRGWRIVYLGPDTPIATIGQAIGELAPDLVVLTATVPQPFAAHADAIANLARHTPVAVAGAGATAQLATRTGTRLLDTDPVTAAELLDRVRPAGSRRSGRR
jgi:MerR family transcriptional regulator, light-induced transcriptional regulator